MASPPSRGPQPTLDPSAAASAAASRQASTVDGSSPRSAPGLSLSTRGSLSSAGPTLLFRSFQHGSFHPRQYTPPL
ncbi:hypothetical protein CEP54_002053 [Fusarium duplospermum]|uniref:Uncharacterized protein n=1 Tax=Fusarium duplospermum TaxID=1325734 RepID=A0A428QXI3_9HYPO|nr:hypothetical protein CEP54_002053 [Fusarium duplospermum]